MGHNHPSAHMKQSAADKELTRRLVEGAKLLDLTVLDHLIVGPTKGDYFSFADDGLIQ
jgi:DNA repair protein RadC